jgi:hypothetical protein
MNTKHTPAPWVTIEGGRGYTITTQESRGISIKEANARLIAAAPELLDILQKLVDADFGSKGWTDSLEVIARQARLTIAKARGEQA